MNALLWIHNYNSYIFFVVKEYKDIPSNGEDDQNNLLNSNKTRLVNEGKSDYESTTRSSQGGLNVGSTSNTNKNIRGIFDDF